MKIVESSPLKSRHVNAAHRSGLRPNRRQPSGADSTVASKNKDRAVGGRPLDGGVVMAELAEAGATVVIVIWLLAPLAPGVTGLETNAQFEFAGRLEQERVTAFENVPTAEDTLIMYWAFPPCVTVCGVVGDATAKSATTPPVPERVTVCALPAAPLLLSV